MTEIYRSNCGLMELRLGEWQEVLKDVKECDSIICDPPYSPRTHKGYMTATDFKENWQEYKKENKLRGKSEKHYKNGLKRREELSYDPLTIDTVKGLVNKFSPYWWVIFGDHISSQWWQKYLENNHVVFAPVPWIRKGSAPRFFGDGPSNACEWITIARQKKLPTNRYSRPGYYTGTIHDEKIVTGGKPIWIMRAIVKDYSNPNDLVVDPFSGGATTLLACAMEGRRCIGAEKDPDTFEKAVKRLKKGYNLSLF